MGAIRKHSSYNLPNVQDFYINPTNQQITAFNNICSEITNGTPAYKAIEELKQISRQEFYNLLHFNESLKESYARACEEREVVMFDKALEVALDNSNDWYINEKGFRVPNPVTVQRARLATETILKMLATMNHKKFGNKTTIDANVNVMQPLTVIEADEILKQIE